VKLHEPFETKIAYKETVSSDRSLRASLPVSRVCWSLRLHADTSRHTRKSSDCALSRGTHVL